MSDRKKILFHSSFSKQKTGFGRNAKAILSYLWKTKKYDIVEYSTGPLSWSDPRCKEVPWKCYGSLPDNNSEISHITDQSVLKQIYYGALNIDKVIEIEKPDVYIGAEDIWAFNGYWKKPWWDKFPCVIWTTLDSLPIYPMAKEAASNTSNFWVWSKFAEREMKKDFSHVTTVNGAVGSDTFHKIEDREKFRKACGIENETVFGFVFRNQLRKLVGECIAGFSDYLKTNDGKLLLHTNWNESGGWDILRFLEEFQVPLDKVLCTYVCSKCKAFTVRSYSGQGLTCNACGAKGSMLHPNPNLGITDSQMNIIYNIMDAYVHPMTSGGLELPIIEAMMAELPVATVPYSCGEEYTDNDFVYSLKYNEYREASSNFRKASVDPKSIANFMRRVDEKRGKYRDFGRRGMEWAKETFSDRKIGKYIEDFVDSIPKNTYSFDKEVVNKNPDYPIPNIEDDVDWLIDLYKNVLKMDEDRNSKGVADWINSLQNGVTREQVYKFFIETARQENSQNEKIELKNLLGDEEKKICYMMPESIGDCFISLNVLESLRRLYPDHTIYVCTKPEHFQIFIPYGYKTIPYSSQLEHFQIWEGAGENMGVVDMFFAPFFATQRFPCYTHNGLDTNELQ